MSRIAIAFGAVALTISTAVTFQLIQSHGDEEIAAPLLLSPPATEIEQPIEAEAPTPAKHNTSSPIEVGSIPKNKTQIPPQIEKPTQPSRQEPLRQRIDNAMEAHYRNMEQLRVLADVQHYLPENQDAPIDVNGILQKWAADDPAKMMAWFKNNFQEPRVSYSPYEFLIAETLALKNAEAAMEYAQLLEVQFPSAQPQITIAIARGVVHDGNFHKALAWLDQIESDEARFEATRVVVSNWAKKQPEAALNWASKLENEEQRDKAVTAVASRIMKDDPQKAMAYVTDVGISEDAMAIFEVLHRKSVAQKAIKAEKRRLKEAFGEQ